MEIVVENYSKKIKKNYVLKDVNYTFRSDKIYGLHGINGSGKTMLLRAIAGLIFSTEGKITIDNKVLHKDISFPESLGVIIEKTELLPDYTAYTNLEILSKIKRVASSKDIIAAITSVGLNPKDKKKVKAFSLGMKQKLSIAQAIFEHPKLLLLDEPTNALDESSVEKIRDLLIAQKTKGTLIIIASHNKDDLDILADEKIKIVDGKISLNA